MSAGPLRILGVSGSLRRGSLNSSLLRACQALAPDGMEIEIYDGLARLPPYDEEVEAAGFPPVVGELRRRVRAADALLIATPEYNHSVPGVLKNAIDWASRPPDVPLARRSAAILGASTGMLGTVRAQYHLRDILMSLDATVVNKPEVFVGAAQGKFGPDGGLTDESTARILCVLLDALLEQTLGLRRWRAA